VGTKSGTNAGQPEVETIFKFEKQTKKKKNVFKSEQPIWILCRIPADRGNRSRDGEREEGRGKRYQVSA
jgi:hypothetical protein